MGRFKLESTLSKNQLQIVMVQQETQKEQYSGRRHWQMIKQDQYVKTLKKFLDKDISGVVVCKSGKKWQEMIFTWRVQFIKLCLEMGEQGLKYAHMDKISTTTTHAKKIQIGQVYFFTRTINYIFN